MQQLEDYLGIEHPVIPDEPPLEDKDEPVESSEDKIQTIESPKYDPQQELIDFSKLPPFLQYYPEIYQIFKTASNCVF